MNKTFERDHRRHMLIHAHERFHRAVTYMAVTSDSLKNRLSSVLDANLSDLRCNELPAPIATQFSEYRKAWTTYDHGRPDDFVQHFGLIGLWMRDLSWQKARALARWIVDAHDELESLLNEEQALRECLDR